MAIQRRLLVSSTSFETRAALLEDGVVVELPHERPRQRGIAGNIYKGRVKKILKGMQSAFVDLGLEKDAFLYVADLDERRFREIVSNDDDAPANDDAELMPIEQRLTEGQELVAQISKEPMAGKGARITTHVSLPGRYLVYMPGVSHIGVSRRIEDTEERARLKGIAEAIRGESPGGLIVRTAGQGQERAALEADVRFLVGQWAAISAVAANAQPPALLHSELGLLDKLLRDLVAGDFAEVVVDSSPDFERCVRFLEEVDPSLVARVRLHDEAGTLFDAFGIEDEIQRALRSRVWLKSGGYLVINQTEALVAVDVNTGRYVGKVCLEDTALRTNLEAVSEVVRQVRLRDLGGIIVIDFIDLDKQENRAKVMTALEEALKVDRSKTKSLQISDFGLVEMTRKRVRVSLERLLLRECPNCGGSGRVKSTDTVCFEALRELIRVRRRMAAGRKLELRAHPDVAAALIAADSDGRGGLAETVGIEVDVRPNPAFRPDHFEILSL